MVTEHNRIKPSNNTKPIQAWLKEQNTIASEHLNSKGIKVETVKRTRCFNDAQLILSLVVGYDLLNKQTSGEDFWVINGNFPCDHVHALAADNARDALRHFALKWQLQAENLAKTSIDNKNEFGRLLAEKAAILYSYYENERLWH